MPYEFTSLAAAADQVRSYVLVHQDKLPEHVRDRLVASTRTGSSPVVMLGDFVRAIYANKSDVDTEAKGIAAGAAVFLQTMGAFPQTLRPRLPAIEQALRRSAKQKAPAGRPWPKAADDPEPDAEFIPPVPAKE